MTILRSLEVPHYLGIQIVKGYRGQSIEDRTESRKPGCDYEAKPVAGPRWEAILTGPLYFPPAGSRKKDHHRMWHRFYIPHSGLQRQRL